MAELTKRLQILMTEEEFQFLKHLSGEKRRSVGDLVRQAVARTYRPSSSVSQLWALKDIEENTFLAESE